jgi:hypothetical protein
MVALMDSIEWNEGMLMHTRTTSNGKMSLDAV